MRSWGRTSEEWNAEFIVYLMNERETTKYHGENSIQPTKSSPYAAIMEWGPGHPGYDSLHVMR